MSRPKSLQRQLAFETIHYVSVSKMGQAILNKNPRETRKLTEKLEDIEFHESGKVIFLANSMTQGKITIRHGV